ncbi:MAG: 5-formyltetrahydrofolate cyclo-ligase [Candidatus Njordarchaeia archaeon]
MHPNQRKPNESRETDEIKKIKEKIREKIWKTMETRGVTRFPKPIYGRIPNFVGSEKAADRIWDLKRFHDADVIFCNPDAPQRKIRYNALMANKTVIMATPKLRKGFLVIKPDRMSESQKYRASSIRGAFQFGKTVEDLSSYRILIKIAGSVAVTLKGARLGKGGGFSDLEYAILREMGAVDDETLIVTSVHELQIVDDVPMTRHDVPVDVILTPSNSYTVEKRFYSRPRGVYWDELDPKKLDEIPILRKLKNF